MVVLSAVTGKRRQPPCCSSNSSNCCSGSASPRRPPPAGSRSRRAAARPHPLHQSPAAAPPCPSRPHPRPSRQALAPLLSRPTPRGRVHSTAPAAAATPWRMPPPIPPPVVACRPLTPCSRPLAGCAQAAAAPPLHLGPMAASPPLTRTSAATAPAQTPHVLCRRSPAGAQLQLWQQRLHRHRGHLQHMQRRTTLCSAS